ncbi:MAG: Crp/Fnr family transcriptional regulator [Chitinophagales bacterium]|nr:Crp/Fnr family transcriptional regulator [Hyphomicrobiales bacterium]
MGKMDEALACPNPKGDARIRGQREGMLLERLSPDERTRVTDAAEIVRYENRGYLVTQGTPSDGLYIILQGLVESVYEETPGRELTLAYWTNGDFIGAPNILSQRPHIWSSKAVGPVEALWLSSAALERLIASSPGFSIALIHCLSFKAECYAKLAQTLATHSIESRLAEALLSQGRAFGDREAGGMVVGKMRQRDLAKLVGATRQSVSLALRKMEAQDLIEIKPTIIVLKQVETLRRLTQH